MELFAHEGIQHKTYLEAALHYLHDRWVLVPFISLVGGGVIYCVVKLYNRKLARATNQ